MSLATYDAVVVGGGPAGYAAAVWLARYRRKTLVIDSGEQRNRAVDRMHGYLGLGDVEPGVLLDRARAELLRYDQTAVRRGLVTEVRPAPEGFHLDIDGEVVSTCRVVLACGVTDDKPDIEGFDEHYGSSVFTCPSCDGFEGRDQDVVTLGWNEGLADFSLHLFEWARSVTIVTDGRRFEGDERQRDALARLGIEILEEPAVAFEGTRGDLRGVRLGDGRLVESQMAFFSIGVRPRSELPAQLGCKTDDEGYVLVDDGCETSVAGVFAAGDLTPGVHLVQVAAAEGAVAGVTCARSLRGEPGAIGSPDPSPSIEAELSG
ncbi:MAG TPA: NAD(P)/FAD-dependent oxidoreductase [Mycobacteriales bacterium]|nr:NAD(P)/FAD-dependent oxidoreductase [Mycobacteriales bacterium]